MADIIDLSMERRRREEFQVSASMFVDEEGATAVCPLAIGCYEIREATPAEARKLAAALVEWADEVECDDGPGA